MDQRRRDMEMELRRWWRAVNDVQLALTDTEGRQQRRSISTAINLLLTKLCSSGEQPQAQLEADYANIQLRVNGFVPQEEPAPA